MQSVAVGSHGLARYSETSLSHGSTAGYYKVVKTQVSEE